MMASAALHFAQAQAWGLLVILGFIGWGLLIVRLLAGTPVYAGLAGCVGVALAVFVGGLLNLLHLITAPVLIVIVVAGAEMAAVDLLLSRGKSLVLGLEPLLSGWKKGSIWLRLLMLAFALLLLFRLSATVRVAAYLPTDDENFYLPTPVKMMAAHGLPPDPFSERRIEGSVGGNYFLQGLILSALPLQNIQMADRYVGAALLALVALALARQSGLSPAATAAFGLLAMLLPSTTINLTFSMLPSALFLALVLAATHEGPWVNRASTQAFLIGLFAGTVCTLKSTYLPHAAMFCGMLYLLGGWRNGLSFALRGWFLALAGALLVLVPWMIATKATCGTYLYPIFGNGYDITAYHPFPKHPAHVTKIISAGLFYGTPLVITILLQLFVLRRDSRSDAFLALSVACLAGTIALDVALGGDTIGRYNFPVIKPVLLLLFLQISLQSESRLLGIPGAFLQAATAAALVLLTVGFELMPVTGCEYTTLAQGFGASVEDTPLASADVRDEYARIDAALPKDGVVLTTLQRPYLLQALGERTLLADWPACAGPPPGWPMNGDGEALADYLTAHSIRYLAYTYSERDNVQLAGSLRQSDLSVFGDVRADQLLGYVQANRQYLELRESRRVIYDDGATFIIDLSESLALARQGASGVR